MFGKAVSSVYCKWEILFSGKSSSPLSDEPKKTSNRACLISNLERNEYTGNTYRASAENIKSPNLTEAVRAQLLKD